MNNFQNYSPSKFYFPANNVAEYCEIYGSDKKRGQHEAKNWEKTNKSRVFKLCQSSEDGKSLQKSQTAVDDKRKFRKTKRNLVQVQEDKSVKKVNHSSVTETQTHLAKAKAVSKVKAQKQSKVHYVNELQFNAQSKVPNVRQKSFGKPEGRKFPLNSLLRKASTETWRKVKFTESANTNGSSVFMERTTSQKGVERSNKAELSESVSEFRQKHINDILKSHAQGIHSASPKSFPTKVYSFQGVSDLLKKAQNLSGTNAAEEATDEKKKAIKAEVKPEEIKTKTSEKHSREGKHLEDNSEEKKRVLSNWIKSPQSNELERRLKGTWEEQKPPLSSDKDQSKDLRPKEENPEEEKKLPKKVEANQQEEKKTNRPKSTAQEDEKKSEKRTTYTDRLLLLRMISKEIEEKKQGEAVNAAQGKETNPKTPVNKEHQENIKKSDQGPPPNRMLDHKVPTEGPVKEISWSDNKELVKLTVDHGLRTRQTRSAELRDIVSQAIKEHKIFCIFDNHSYIVKPVREELLARGWLEVVPDRRLIPRRRPPPMGPTFERDKSVTERNCNTLEAILTAKETFADELQETVSKTPSFRWTVEKPKLLPGRTPPNLNKKFSDDSLNETLSEFRIIPPTTDRKKNNIEIREFTTKYNAILAKEFDREREIKILREKEKTAKSKKNEKSQMSRESNKSKSKSITNTKNSDENDHVILPGSKSFEDILLSIRENKKTLVQAASEIKHMEGKGLGSRPELGVLFDAAESGAKALAPVEPPKTQDKMVGTSPPEKTVCVNGKAIFTESEVRTMSKLIQSNNARIHFMWLSIKPAIHLKCFNYSPEIVNKFQRTTFCTKIGLWSHLNNIQWYAHEVHFPAKSPRMYNTGEADDLQAFLEDFQITACIGLLKWLSDTFYERGLKAVQAKKGKVPLKAFEFAIKQCEKYMRFKENEDLSILDESRVHSDEWNTFLQWFYIITNDHGKIQESSSGQLMVVYTKAVETLRSIRRHWPEIDIDGRLNIWIMKPYCASCGRGIFMTNNVYYISQHSKYIVQKYIEKPLLIYNTKFDIRQWFMITKLTPLEIWMYKECYLRFCTQPFALRNLHESVHLSNNSVQRKYISYRDPSLPDQNMWDSNTFRLYLKTIGQPTTWEDIIYPGMKDAIVSTMLASQDTFDGPRKSWFEVYGADFMLSANLKEGPWLIEINENPAMDPSTKVTARLCPQMLRDVIKVVVDKRANRNANTGQWELIYRQNYSPSFGTVDLDIKGKKIARVPHARSLLNPPQYSSSTPVCLKKQISSDMETDRLYEYVKSLEKQHNKGDAIGSGKTRGETKKMKKSPSTRVSPKHRSSGTGSAGRDSTSDFPFAVTEKNKTGGAMAQTNFRAEKYKFTKFYNV